MDRLFLLKKLEKRDLSSVQIRKKLGKKKVMGEAKQAPTYWGRSSQIASILVLTPSSSAVLITAENRVNEH